MAHDVASQWAQSVMGWAGRARYRASQSQWAAAGVGEGVAGALEQD